MPVAPLACSGSPPHAVSICLVYIYSGFEVTCPDCDLKSALDHAARDKLGRCLQHRGGEPEQAKGADGMQLFALDCIAHIVDAEMD